MEDKERLYQKAGLEIKDQMSFLEASGQMDSHRVQVKNQSDSLVIFLILRPEINESLNPPKTETWSDVLPNFMNGGTESPETELLCLPLSAHCCPITPMREKCPPSMQTIPSHPLSTHGANKDRCDLSLGPSIQTRKTQI